MKHRFCDLEYTFNAGDSLSLPRAEFYHETSFGGASVTYEDAVVIYALTLAVKPWTALETGGGTGCSALHIAAAMRDNGFGFLVSVEGQVELVQEATATAARLGLTRFVKFVPAVTPEMIERMTSDRPFDLVMLDSGCGHPAALQLRLKELSVLEARNLLSPGALVLVHDTSPFHHGGMMISKEIGDHRLVELPTSRGLAILQRGSPWPGGNINEYRQEYSHDKPHAQAAD